MKITVISFDFWHYDQYIVQKLKEKGIDAHHINIGAYRHKNLGAKVTNAVSKTLLGKNLKNIKRQELIIEKLDNIGRQDQILVINPELIDRKYHEVIRKSTNKYIAYLYDSMARCPADHLLDLFDEVYSFDKNDTENYGFKLIPNYNYLSESTVNKNPKYSLVYLASFDKRLETAEKVAEKLDHLRLNYFFKIIGKKAWKKQVSVSQNSQIEYSIKRVSHEEITNFYDQGVAILDLVRENQDGLSFRIFEAMALKKKIVTNNQTVSEYDFYNPNNILILSEDLSNLEKSFFETPYQELSPEIYRKYTVGSWVETVFDLK